MKQAKIDGQVGVRSYPTVTVAAAGGNETILKFGLENSDVLIARVQKLLMAVKPKLQTNLPPNDATGNTGMLPPEEASYNELPSKRRSSRTPMKDLPPEVDEPSIRSAGDIVLPDF
jgi:hypothetical protein